MAYPDLPNNRLIVDGVDISMRFQIALLDGYTLEPPEPKTYTVDIPGGNGVIDLTESLSGDVAYKNRKQTFEFACIFPENFEWVKTELSNFLHGKAFDYTMTMDPGYTYHGRFKVTEYSHTAYTDGIVGDFKIEIDANPYKKKEKKVYKLNGTGGKMFRLESGRRKVYPILETEQPCTVNFKGRETAVPTGTYRLNDVLFEQGFNDFYINTFKLHQVRWDDVDETGEYPLSWDGAKQYRWDELQSTLTGDKIPQSWNQLYQSRWSELSTKRWTELDDRVADMPNTSAYLTYEWEDL